MSSNQDYQFGLNVHWSRLKKHKKAGAKTFLDESINIEIESPYVFYLPSTKEVFLFYFYKENLLCKIFNEGIFQEAAEDSDKGFDFVKATIEKANRAYFVDGNMSDPEVAEELHFGKSDSTKEILIQGNIIFPFQFAKEPFDENRAIAAQRVCACEMPNGKVRVFYKPKKGEIRAALWSGEMWYPEDLLRTIKEPPITIPTPSGYAEVTGGFGPDKFT